MRALRFIPALLLLACGPCRGGEEESAVEEKSPQEAPLVSPKKSFSIVSANTGDREDPAEKVMFAKKALKAVPFEVTSWRGFYYISPDDRWILRLQKVGSGESEAWLYRVEKDGRVTRVANFEDQVWTASDAVSKLKRKALYHTGVDEVGWSADSKTLTLKVSGANAGIMSTDGINTLVTYDISKKAFQAKPLPESEEEEKEESK